MPQSQSVQEAVDHFKRLPWCAKLIEAPGVKSLLSVTRRERGGSGGRVESQDELLRTVLNNDDNVPFILFLYQDPDSPEAAAAGPISDGSSSAGPTLSIVSASLLLDLKEGLKGFNGFTHGGFLATIMDEIMGCFIFSNYEYQRAQEDAARRGGAEHWTVPPGVLDMNSGMRVMTASMNVRFRRPVSLPSTVVTTATLNRIDGRKIYLDVTVNDGSGAAYATCEGMWMIVAAPKNPSSL